MHFRSSSSNVLCALLIIIFSKCHITSSNEKLLSYYIILYRNFEYNSEASQSNIVIGNVSYYDKTLYDHKKLKKLTWRKPSTCDIEISELKEKKSELRKIKNPQGPEENLSKICDNSLQIVSESIHNLNQIFNMIKVTIPDAFIGLVLNYNLFCYDLFFNFIYLPLYY